MRRSNRAAPVLRLLAVLAVVAVVVSHPAQPASAERIQSNIVLIRADDVVTEDLYAVGEVVEIAGEVQGDLSAAAFEEVRISGVVRGDAVVAAARVVVTGTVEGSLRVVAGELIMDGSVADDVFGAAWTMATAQGSEVGRDVVMATWAGELRGDIGRSLEGRFRTLRLAGSIGATEVDVRELAVLPRTVVRGDLVYRSETEATVDETAEIAGTLVQQRPLPPNVRVRALGIFASALGIFGAAAIGLGVIWSAPDRAARAATVARSRPLAAAGWGAAVLGIPLGLIVVTALVVSIVPLSVAVPMMAVMVPLVVVALSLVAVGVLLAPVPVASAIGARDGRTVYGAFLVGFIVLAALMLVPFVASLVLVATAVLGIGAWFGSASPPEHAVLEDGGPEDDALTDVAPAEG